MVGLFIINNYIHDFVLFFVTVCLKRERNKETRNGNLNNSTSGLYLLPSSC
uniref:Uncharacterized protein n=1 Tax=Tetranychus urticae TaxID=32264 RepID=T1JUM4_TETUR